VRHQKDSRSLNALMPIHCLVHNTARHIYDIPVSYIDASYVQVGVALTHVEPGRSSQLASSDICESVHLRSILSLDLPFGLPRLRYSRFTFEFSHLSSGFVIHRTQHCYSSSCFTGRTPHWLEYTVHHAMGGPGTSLCWYDAQNWRLWARFRAP